MMSQIGSRHASVAVGRLRSNVTFRSVMLTYFGFIVTEGKLFSKGSCSKRGSALARRVPGSRPHLIGTWPARQKRDSWRKFGWRAQSRPAYEETHGPIL